MTMRVKSVASMPLVDGFGITAVQDHRSAWRFANLHQGFFTIPIKIHREDRQRGFESPEAVADHFRKRYGHML